MPEHLAAGGARVLPQTAYVLPAQAATHYHTMLRDAYRQNPRREKPARPAP